MIGRFNHIEHKKIYIVRFLKKSNFDSILVDVEMALCIDFQSEGAKIVLYLESPRERKISCLGSLGHREMHN